MRAWVSSEAVLITDELQSRPIDKADFEIEKLAFQDLAQEMVDRPEEVLPTLVERAMEESGADSAGISLLEPAPPGPDILRWHHGVGRYAGNSGITFPAGEGSPEGVCLTAAAPILMARPERVYPHLAGLGAINHEILLVPFHVAGAKPSGALWVINHEEGKQFDHGDARVLTELAVFAGLAVRMIQDADALRVTEQRLNDAFEHQEMLTREMSHRVNNLFAVMTAITSLTARSATTTDEMARSLTGRLLALSQAHNLFEHETVAGEGSLQTATLAELLKVIFAPYPDSEGAQVRCVFEGPQVVIGKKAVTNLSLVLHELATNAAKYGALSVPGGSIHIVWCVKGNKVVLTWHESGGPPIANAPEKQGFGTILTGHTITGQFRGEIEYDWKLQGLFLIMTLPSERISN